MRETQLPHVGRINRSLQVRREIVNAISYIQVSKRPDGKHPAAADFLLFLQAAAAFVEPYAIAEEVTELAAPVSTQAPRIATTAPRVGKLIVAEQGQWTGDPVLTFQWYADTDPIKDAVSNTFLPTEAEKGKALRLLVTGKNGAGSTNRASNTTPVVA